MPYKSFRTKDGDILLGGGNDRLFGILCEGIGRPQWAEDPKFITNAQRVANRVELEDMIESVTRERTTREWLQVFDGQGLPYAAVNDVQATLNHEHTQARNMVVETDHPACGSLKLVNHPVKWSETQPVVRRPPPTLGQHTDEVLREHLDMSEPAIAELKAKGIIR